MSSGPKTANATRQRGPRKLVRALVATVLAGLFSATVAAAGGCELIVGDALPAFSCASPPATDTCPDGQVCDPLTGHCIADCSQRSCGEDMYCDTATHLCKERIPFDATSDDATGPRDAALAYDSSSDIDGAGAPDADAKSTTDRASPWDVAVDVQPSDTEGGLADAGDDQTGDVASDVAVSCGMALLCKCSGPNDCKSHVCADRLAVGIALIGAAGGDTFCSKPCCTSADCDLPNAVCYGSALGGNYCVDARWLNRTQPLGVKLGGQACSGPTECRSGVCSNANICADTCCSSNSSSAGNSGCATMPSVSCNLSPFPGLNSFDQQYVANCSAFNGGQPNSPCTTAMDCQSGICDGQPGTCRSLCRGPQDCHGGRCAYFGPTPPRHYDASVVVYPLAAVCGGAVGTMADGQTCKSHFDCQSGFCSPSAGKCTDVCFTDSDCTVPGWYCRPEPITVQVIGPTSPLYCGGALDAPRDGGM